MHFNRNIAHNFFPHSPEGSGPTADEVLQSAAAHNPKLKSLAELDPESRKIGRAVSHMLCSDMYIPATDNARLDLENQHVPAPGKVNIHMQELIDKALQEYPHHHTTG